MRALDGGAAPLRARAATGPVLALSRVPALLLAGLAALAGAAVFAGGGSTDSALPWIGGGALVLAVGACAAGGVGVLPWPRLVPFAAVSVVAFGLFVAWNGASVLWSIEPERSWNYFNRGLVYFAFLVAGLFAGGLVRRMPARLAQSLAVLAAAVLVFALAGKVFPGLDPDGGRVARLREPVGYWNALALLFVLGVPATLWLASAGRFRKGARAAATVLLFGLVVGTLLTYSRAGVLVGLLVVGGWLAVGVRRLESVAALAVAVPFGAGLAAWAFRQPGLALDRQPEAARAQDGAELGIALAVGALAVFVLAQVTIRALDRSRLALPRAPVLRRAAIGSAALIAVAALAVGAWRADELAGWWGTQVDEIRNPPTDLVTQDPSRLGSLSSNNRWTWWTEAWDAFAERPVAGSGAGTFEQIHRRVNPNRFTLATEPHNEALQFLAELGLVGFGLAGAAAGFGLAAVALAVRRSGVERGAATALGLGLAAYVLHGLVDWDWDFLAVNAPVFTVFGALFVATAPEPRVRRRSLLVPAAAIVVLGAGLSSLFAPWIAERKVDASFEALARGDASEALGSARLAARLNPVSFEPFLAEAMAQTALGDLSAARSTLVEAVERLPDNAEAWYELGRFDFEYARRRDLALRALDRARELDPAGPAAAYIEHMRSVPEP